MHTYKIIPSIWRSTKNIYIFTQPCAQVLLHSFLRATNLVESAYLSKSVAQITLIIRTYHFLQYYYYHYCILLFYYITTTITILLYYDYYYYFIILRLILLTILVESSYLSKSNAQITFTIHTYFLFLSGWKKLTLCGEVQKIYIHIYLYIHTIYVLFGAYNFILD